MMAKSTPMNAERFAQLIDAYGAESARWPAAERADALAFMDAHPAEAAIVLAPARELDDALEGARMPVSDTSFLAARILKAAQESDTAASSKGAEVVSLASGRRAPWKSIAATFLVTTSIGFAAGQSAAAKSARIAEAETLLSLTLNNPYDSADMWEDLQ